jgi:hypothetical protein
LPSAGLAKSGLTLHLLGFAPLIVQFIVSGYQIAFPLWFTNGGVLPKLTLLDQTLSASITPPDEPPRKAAMFWRGTNNQPHGNGGRWVT